jgi:hypothetical protein
MLRRLCEKVRPGTAGRQATMAPPTDPVEIWEYLKRGGWIALVFCVGAVISSYPRGDHRHSTPQHLAIGPATHYSSHFYSHVSLTDAVFQMLGIVALGTGLGALIAWALIRLGIISKESIGAE